MRCVDVLVRAGQATDAWRLLGVAFAPVNLRLDVSRPGAERVLTVEGHAERDVLAALRAGGITILASGERIDAGLVREDFPPQGRQHPELSGSPVTRGAAGGVPVFRRGEREARENLLIAGRLVRDEAAPPGVDTPGSLDRQLLDAAKEYVNTVVGPNINGDRC